MAVEDFNHIMSPKTDDELLTIVEVDNKEYKPDALEAAKLELDRREIPYHEGSRAHVPASFAEKYYESGNRFWVYLIDSMVFGTLGSIVGSLAGVDPDSLGWYVMSSVVVFFYYFLTEGFFGKSVGKMFLGLRVVDINGEAASMGAIALRSLCRLIPFDPLSFLFGNEWTKEGKLKGNWHDQLSGTYVVSERKIALDKSNPDSKYNV